MESCRRQQSVDDRDRLALAPTMRREPTPSICHTLINGQYSPPEPNRKFEFQPGFIVKSAPLIAPSRARVFIPLEIQVEAKERRLPEKLHQALRLAAPHTSSSYCSTACLVA